MANKPGILHRLLTGFWTLVDQARRSLVNILFLLIIYAIIKSVFFSEVPTVPSNSALELKPVGYLVDELDYVEPIDEMLGELSEQDNQVPQTLLRDLINAIDKARKDSNITALVLNLGNFYGAAPSKLQDLAQAIQTFKTSGKPVYAYSEFYNQAQYYLAAQADEVYMDPLGTLFVEGYGRYNTYFKGALEKLGVNFHIFKVGTFKSAVEPFIRDDMSDQAKEANLHYLSDLWQSYTSDVAQARELTAADIDRYSNELLINLSQANTEASSIAVNSSLIDSLKTRHEMINYLIEKIGGNFDGDDYQKISHKQYLKRTTPLKLPVASAADKIAIITAKGTIYNGNQKAGAIGGQSTSKLIRKARLDDTVKALVLRVDSPGGSAYASEIIRREILKVKEAGKPVIVSMGSYAASGGYWISASADEIWASPTTITGSIGVFGLLPTFEKPLNQIGIHRDGVGTTNLTGAFDAGKPLRDDVGKMIQNSIDNIYNSFLTIVSEGRGISKEAVDKIAQGRVWSGKTAQELGLVDHLGGIEQAIESAATKAELVSYETIYIQQELSESERFIKQMFNSSALSLFNSAIGSSNKATDSKQFMMISPALLMLQQINESYQSLATMNDPQNAYAHCLCTVN